LSIGARRPFKFKLIAVRVFAVDGQAHAVSAKASHRPIRLKTMASQMGEDGLLIKRLDTQAEMIDISALA
jgi:hypothetical protein